MKIGLARDALQVPKYLTFKILESIQLLVSKLKMRTVLFKVIFDLQCWLLSLSHVTFFMEV